MEKIHLGAGDWVMIGLYIVICQSISIFVRFHRNFTKTVDERFLPGHRMTWLIVGCSIFATNIGSHVFIGLAGSAAAKGIAVVAYQWLGALAVLLSGYLFAPVYMGSGVRTLPQYMYERFQSRRLRIYFGIISILNSLFTKIAIDTYATGLFLKYLFNEECNVYLSSFVLLSLTAIYTLVGGLTSVMYVGTLQCVLMLCGSFTVLIIGANKVGGLTTMWQQFPHVVGNVTVPYTTAFPNMTVFPSTTVFPNTTAFPSTTVFPNTTFKPTTYNHSTINTSVTLPVITMIRNVVNISTSTLNLTTTIQPSTTPSTTSGLWNYTTPNATTITGTHIPRNTTACYGVGQHWNNIFRPLQDEDLPWLGLVLSLPVSSVWYWCTNQVFVQQVLTSTYPRQVRRATVLAGLLNFFPFLLIVLPGMTARVLFPDIIACPDAASCIAACNNALGCSHLAYYKLLSGLGLSQGIVGMIYVMILSAMMSSVSNTFIGVSTVFTRDIWNTLRPDAKEKEVVWVGRVAVVLTVGVALAWIPVVENLNANVTYKHLQVAQSYIAPSICAAVLMGMLFVSVTETGTLVSLILGAVLAITRFSLDLKYPPPQCGELDDRPLVVRLNFLYCSLVMFLVSVVCVGVVSICTQPQPLGMLGKLTWTTMDKERYVEKDTDRGKEMGMDNMTYRDSVGSDDHCGRKFDETEGEEEEENTDVGEGESKVELFEKWFSVGALLVIFCVLLIVFA